MVIGYAGVVGYVSVIGYVGGMDVRGFSSMWVCKRCRVRGVVGYVIVVGYVAVGVMFRRVTCFEAIVLEYVSVIGSVAL